MLPNFNPFTALSEPRQDLVSDAMAVIQSQRVHCGNNDGAETPSSDPELETPVNVHLFFLYLLLTYSLI